MGQSLDTIIKMTTNNVPPAIGVTNFGMSCFLFSDASEAGDKGVMHWQTPEQAIEHFSSRVDLVRQLTAWKTAGGGSLVTYGYLEADSNPVISDDTIALSAPAKDKTPATPETLLLKEMSLLSDVEPTNYLEALTAAAKLVWFYFPFLSQTKIVQTPEQITAVINWCDANTRFYLGGRMITGILDSSVVNDEASLVKLAQKRRSACGYSKLNPDLYIETAAFISRVNYYAEDSYLDLEYKRPGTGDNDLTPTEIAILKAKGAFYCTTLVSEGSETGAMLLNTNSASPYNETISEVIAYDAAIIGLKGALGTTITSQKNAPQTPEGQKLMIDSGKSHFSAFTANSFLGPREISHPVTGKITVVPGYLITTVPEDIYKLTDAQRDNHEFYPLNTFIYASGSGRTIECTVNIM